MSRFGQILRQKIRRERNEQFSSKLQIESSLSTEEVSDRNRVDTKTKEKISRKPNFLRRIFACYVKDNIGEERDTDRREQNEVDRRSSVENGESSSSVAERSDFNKNKNVENAEKQHSPKATRPTLQEDNEHLSSIAPVENEEKMIQRQKRRVAKSQSYPLQFKETSLSRTMAELHEHPKDGKETINKRSLPKSASSGLSGNHPQSSSTISKAGGANLCSPMLRYQSSPEVTISRKSPSIQTVYFRPTPVPDAGVVSKQLGRQKVADLKNQKDMDVNWPSHTTHPKRFQMPTKFLENIEQAKKDCRDSVAVYRVHYENNKIKLFRSN